MFRIAMFTFCLFFQTCFAQAHDISMDVYLVDHDFLCKGDKPYSECRKFRSSGTAEFIETVRERGFDQLVSSTKGSLRKANFPEYSYFFRSINAYRDHVLRVRPRTLYKAALFVFNLENFQTKEIQFIRFVPNQPIRAPRITKPGGRFIDFMDAVYLHPKERAIFSLIVDGHQHEFRFKK